MKPLRERNPRRAPSLTLLLALTACGDVANAPSKQADATSTSRDAGRDAHREAAADATTDANTGPVPDACPTQQPAIGARCAVSFYEWCEYGSDPEPGCDPILVCSDGGWAASYAGGDCGTTNPPMCPAEFSDIRQDAACGFDAGSFPGIHCYYPQARCWCDLGVATWGCDTAFQPNCPEPRPRFGTPCDAADDTLLCNYQSCLGEVCQSGSWQLDDGICGK